MFLQDCVCGFLPDESDPVGRRLLCCCSLWYTRGYPGTVVWHLCSSHFCGCILWLQKTSEYAFLNRPFVLDTYFTHDTTHIHTLAVHIFFSAQVKGLEQSHCTRMWRGKCIAGTVWYSSATNVSVQVYFC